jgi:hypothetical protein
VVAKADSASRRETVFRALSSEAERAAEISAMMGSAGGEEAARQLLAEAKGAAAPAAA